MPGRKKLPQRRRVHLAISEDTMALIDLALVDPVWGVRQHGSLSTLVTRLLREWLAQQRNTIHPQPQIEELDNNDTA